MEKPHSHHINKKMTNCSKNMERKPNCSKNMANYSKNMANYSKNMEVEAN